MKILNQNLVEKIQMLRTMPTKCRKENRCECSKEIDHPEDLCTGCKPEFDSWKLSMEEFDNQTGNC